MIADDAEIFIYLLRNMVFGSAETKVATWRTGKGVPADFTTNGIVVTDDQKLLAGSRVYSKVGL
jgi:hypothetical protein